MPSRVRAVLSLDDREKPYTGRAVAAVLYDYGRHYGLKPDFRLKGDKLLGAIVTELKASKLFPAAKLQFFRENRFQNPNRSEYAALSKSTKLKKKPPAPPRARRAAQRAWNPRENWAQVGDAPAPIAIEQEQPVLVNDEGNGGFHFELRVDREDPPEIAMPDANPPQANQDNMAAAPGFRQFIAGGRVRVW